MRILVVAAILGTLSSVYTIGAAEAEPKPDPAPLYVHFFTPAPDGTNETLHLLTVRFRTSEEFEVITKWSFQGRIDAREKQLAVNLKTSYNGGTFVGEVDHGKRYETTFLVTSPSVRLCSFAITQDRDPKEFVSRPYFEEKE